MRVFAIIAGLCFVLSAAVQYNDPDPEFWIPIYLLPALVAFYFLKKRLPSIVYLILAAVYFIMAIYQWPPEFEGFLFNEVTKMRNINIELARESFGMGIVAVAMTVFWLYGRREDKLA